jgi:alpha-glucosidase
MSREGARGQEWNAWAPDGGNPPEHEAVLPFTRLLGGPMDFTPGIFDVLLDAGNRPNNRVNTTVAKQLALYVVLYSPLQMAADLPDAYEARPDLFRWIETVPVDWAESRVLHGAIGDAVVVARKDRHSDEWFLGAVTDEQARALPTRLDFLDAGRGYVAEVYRDADDAHWQTNPLAVTVETGLVDGSTVLPFRLAAGGGQAVRLRPATDADSALPRLAP